MGSISDHMTPPYRCGVVWSAVYKSINIYGHVLRSSEMIKRAYLVNFYYFNKQSLCYLT